MIQEKTELAIFFLTIFFLISFVCAAPPGLPVLVSGKVVYDNGFVIEDAVVNVKWIDLQGNPRKTTTTTLNSDEAVKLGDSSLKGHYAVEINDIDFSNAIIIESSGTSVELEAQPGIVLTSQDIVLSSDIEFTGDIKDVEPGFLKKLVGFLFEYLKKNKGFKVSVANSKDLEEDKYAGANSNISKYMEEFSNKSGSASKNLSYNQLTNLTNGTGNQTNNRSGEVLSADFSGNQTGESSGNTGYSEGDADKPVEGELSNLPYEGFFKRLAGNNADSQSSFFAEAGEFYQEKSKLFISLFSFMILVFSTLLLLIIIIVIKKIIMFLSKQLEEKVDTSIKNIHAIASRKLVNKKKLVLNAKANLLDAVNIFTENNVTIIPVISSSRVVGIITKKSVLNHLISKKNMPLEKISVEKVMKKEFVSLNEETQMGDIYSLMLQKNSDAVIVQKDSHFIGTIDFFNILEVLAKANLKFDNPPTLNEAMFKEVVLSNSEANLFDLYNLFLKKNCEYAIIKKEDKIIGIVTTKDLISALKKGMDLKKTYAINIMSSNLISMNPGTSVYEAFKIAIERRFNQIPIVMEGKVVGIVSVKYLVKLYYDLISDLNKRLKDKVAKKSVEITKEE